MTTSQSDIVAEGNVSELAVQTWIAFLSVCKLRVSFSRPVSGEDCIGMKMRDTRISLVLCRCLTD